VELRNAIAEHVQTARGTRCVADQVFIVAGAQRGLQTICAVLLDPGDRVWLEEPGYPGARSALVGAGARIVPARVDSDGLDVAAAARRAADARMAYVTPSHQFPLGVPMSLSRRLALLKWASSAGAWVVEDDYDSEFRYGTRPIPCLHGLDADGRVIYVGTFAKTVFPAMRLEANDARFQMSTQINQIKRSTLGCCTTPSTMWFWTAMFVLFYGAGLLLGAVWPTVRHHQDVVILMALAAACFVNFYRNRTVHCGLTAPLFLAGAIAAFLADARIWRVNQSALWGVVLFGVGLAFLIEWRTVGRDAST
jgi:hypothetical protein